MALFRMWLGTGLVVFGILVVTDGDLPEGWWRDWSFVAAMLCVMVGWPVVLVMMVRRRR